MLGLAIALMERGFIPDSLIRIGIRELLAKRLRAEDNCNESLRAAMQEQLISELRNSPIALHPTAANQQHYELPAGFFQKALGPRLKYSSCYWPEEVRELTTAEAAMPARAS